MDYPGMEGRWTGLFYVVPGTETLQKRITDGSGAFIGVTGAHPDGVYVSLDTDRNGTADLFFAQPVDGSRELVSDAQTLLATDAGLQFLRQRGNWDVSLLCSPTMSELADAADSPTEFGAAAASASLCPVSSSGSGSPMSGGNRWGSGVGRSGLDKACAGQETSGPTQTMGGGARKDPRQIHWADGAQSAAESLNPIPTSTEDAVVDQATDAVVGAVESFARMSIGWALTTVKTVRAFVDGATGEFVNEADRDLYYFERNAQDGDQPDPEVVREACSAGSTSPYCGGGSSGSGGSSSPMPGRENTLAERCEAMQEARWRQESFTRDTRYVRQECDNPAEQAPATSMNADGMTLQTFCGAQVEPVVPDLSTIIGGNGCPPTATPGPDGTCRSGGPASASPRSLPYGYIDVLGVDMRLRPCPDATCSPWE